MKAGLVKHIWEWKWSSCREYYGESLFPANLLDNSSTRLNDEEARIEIEKRISGFCIAQIKSLPKQQKDEVIKKVKCIEGVSQRQLARILGISQTLISIA